MGKRGVWIAVIMLLAGTIFFSVNSTDASAAGSCNKAADCNACESCDIGFWCKLTGWCDGDCVSVSCDVGSYEYCSGNYVWSHLGSCGVSQYDDTISTCSVSDSRVQSCGSQTCCGSGCVDTNTDVNNCGSCGNTCQSGWSCESGSCKAPPPKCFDTDKDGYDGKTSDCPSGADCNDANANIYPGSCSSAAVAWSGCATSTTGGCGSGTCARALPSGCGDVCGDGKVTGDEGCDWGISSGGWGNGVWAPKWVSCPGGYDDAYGQYRCKSDCSGIEYDYACQNCGDGTCNGPETKTSCAADCGRCGNGVTDAGEVCDPGSLVTGSKTQSCGSGYPSVTATCKSDCSSYDYVCQSCGDSIVNGPEVCEAGQTKACPGGGTVSCRSLACTWLACPSCSNGVKNGDETGVDCGGSCVTGSEVCNDGVDNDKDCLVDEGCAVVAQATCSDGSKNGDETGVDCGGSCVTGSEVCNDGVDNDKDCLVDEGCPTCSDSVKNQDETGVDCGGTCPVPGCSKSVGVCTGKVKACSASGWVDCSEASYGANPNYELAETKCDNLDNDCDGQIDEGCDDDGDEFCDSSMTWSGMVLSSTCAVASAGDCNDNNANINPGAVDVCENGVDEDCSGGDAACPVLDPCAGVEKDSDQGCCASAGFQWVKSGEANVGSDKVDNQFQDRRGERKAASKLLPNEYRCFGDDADEQFFVRTRDCKAGVCTSSAADKALCDKPSDCVYSGKCYSDVEAVASTFFSGSVGAVWSSSWQKEVTADVNGDGRLEVCDPGEWQSPAGTVAGAVRNVSTSNGDGPCPVQGCPVAGALVKIFGTSPLLTATTAADGTYSIANVPLGTYDLTASRPVDGYEDSAVLNQELVSGALTVGFTLVRARGGCEDDCTTVGSNRCDASCHGKGLCWFYNSAAKAACDGTFGIVNVPGGQAVECCKGRPYTPIKADVTVKAKQIIKTVRPILYKGKLVKLVTLLFIPDK